MARYEKFWERTGWLVPCLVRLLARKRWGRPMSEEEISAASGLTVYQVSVITQQTDWAGIDLPTMRAFTVGCACDFDNREQMKRVESYLRSKPTWQYLRQSPQWETLFKPLILKWQKWHEAGGMGQESGDRSQEKEE